MEKETDEKGNPLTYWGGIKNNDTTEEQLLQEARLEAEKVYPFKKGNDFSKGFNSEIVKINLDLLNKQTIFIKGYIANAKKQMSEAVEFAEWLSSNEWVKRTRTHPNKVGQYYSHIHCEYKSIDKLYELFKQQKQE